MENNNIIIKEKELYKIFSENENNYGLIISMFSLERLWAPFTFASKPFWEVQSIVRQCMDMMWDRIFEGTIAEDKKSQFIDLLDSITDQYSENVSNSVCNNYCFDKYLINALYSNVGYFFNNPMSDGYKISTSASAAVFELLSDYIVDSKSIKSEELFQKAIKEDKLILSEIDRIDKELIFTQKNYNDLNKIRELKEYYMNLEILPLNALFRKENDVR